MQFQPLDTSTRLDSELYSGNRDVEMKSSNEGASLLDRLAGMSPRSNSSNNMEILSPGKKKPSPSSTMQRRLVDMLSPLLPGRSKQQHQPLSSTPSTPRANESPRPPLSPVPAQTAAPASPTMHPHHHVPSTSNPLNRATSHNSGLIDIVSKMNISEVAASPNGGKKTSGDSDTSMSSTTTTYAPSAPPAPVDMRPAHLQPPVPVVSPLVANHNHPAPALLTQNLERLLNAARHCSLPPSPRAEPPPGAPPGTPNQTLLLSLSHSLPPRMQRSHWCLDDYTVLEKLYKGYASTVYKAMCKRSGEIVVLKVYTLEAVCDLYKYQIYREVRLHGSLQHENIVHLYASFQEGDHVIMVQEYADGSDLFTLLHKYGGRLSERLAVQMVLDPFLRVLQYLHSRAIIHRDIKPENILFTKNMGLKLGDFGLAIDLREERAVTRAGTLDYMAPEVLRCPYKKAPEENKDNEALHYGARVDAWAVGVLTYELLVGFPPFFDQSKTGTEQRIVNCMPAFPAGFSEEAKHFICWSLHKNPAERPTILDMLHHGWVEQFRARRSMRHVSTGTPSAGLGNGSAHAVLSQPQQQALQQSQAQGSASRKAATQTTIVAASGVQASMQQAALQQQQQRQQAASPTAPYPSRMNNIMTSINDRQQQAQQQPLQQQYSARSGLIATPPPAPVYAQPSAPPMPSAAKLQHYAQPLIASSPTSPLSMASRKDSADGTVFMNVNDWQGSSSKAPAAQVMARFGPAEALLSP